MLGYHHGVEAVWVCAHMQNKRQYLQFLEDNALGVGCTSERRQLVRSSEHALLVGLVGPSLSAAVVGESTSGVESSGFSLAYINKIYGVGWIRRAKVDGWMDRCEGGGGDGVPISVNSLCV